MEALKDLMASLHYPRTGHTIVRLCRRPYYLKKMEVSSSTNHAGRDSEHGHRICVMPNFSSNILDGHLGVMLGCERTFSTARTPRSQLTSGVEPRRSSSS